MKLFGDVIEAFVGGFGVAVDVNGWLLRAAFLGDGGRERFAEIVAAEGDELVPDAKRTRHVTEQLAEYFAGRRTTFDVELELRGTDFQRAVWTELCNVPFGRTMSYGELARRVGQPGGSRAVGQANHVNPIPILVPCHRIIGADGTLTGFGGGVDVKRALLDFERGQASLFV